MLEQASSSIPVQRLLAAAALLLAGCAASPGADQWATYRRALAEAAVAEPAKALPLKPLPPTPTVRVVSWVGAGARPCDRAGCSFFTGDDRWWVTVEGEVQAMCRQWGLHGEALRERLEQLLGLPPHTPARWRKTHLVTFEVPRQALQRPCLGERVDESGTPRCSLRPSDATDPEVRRFVLEQMASTWVAGVNDPPGYPFTRLGYTFDWHPSAAARRHYGATEFLVRPRTEARLLAVAATDDYCAPGDD